MTGLHSCNKKPYDVIGACDNTMLCDALRLSNILDFSHRPVFLRSTFLSIFFGHFSLFSPSKNVVSILCLSLFKVKTKET